jgi:hypothetical protein
MEHLKAQFIPGMSEENYGTFWHDVHEIPMSAWDRDNPQHVLAVNQYLNLAPIEAAENKRKGGTNRHPPGHFDAAIVAFLEKLPTR